ncbi:MAG: cytochrome c3 family protein [Salibacteraceae bacterium]
MNCHVAIPEGSLYGKEEIAKIYKAAGWDNENQRYTGETEPIKWVKIHNLPDFAYFNHSQHVVVGKQKCQTCHGEVEKMEVLAQHSELTMGWCINCHRETKVTMEDDNEYYQGIKEDLMIKHRDLGLQEFTVEQIGGLECAKCHY